MKIFHLSKAHNCIEFSYKRSRIEWLAFFVCVGSEDHGIHLMLLWIGMLSRDGISYTGHMLTLGHSRREIRYPHLDHSTLFFVLVQTHVCVVPLHWTKYLFPRKTSGRDRIGIFAFQDSRNSIPPQLPIKY